MCRSVYYIAVLYCALLNLLHAEALLDRTLEKVAASMVREKPEIKGDLTSREMRVKLVAEFKNLGAGTISPTVHKQIKRTKVNYESSRWLGFLKDFEQAQFSDPKCIYLLERAKEKKSRGEEHYVLKRLMREYYDAEIQHREDVLKKRLSRVGKAYTYYKREHDFDPADLAAFVADEADRICTNPLTNENKQWVYVGAGPAEIKGSNRYRVVAYSPFPSRKKEYRWIVYKGGLVGEWKESTLLSAVDKMDTENRQIKNRSTSVSVENFSEKITPSEHKKAPQSAEKELNITIKELW